jgi:predicted NUDIX family NTP pyrophosphohydrolase
MPKLSAGLVMYRIRGGQLQVLLVHPGGPFWAKKNLGAWSIPKGEVEPNEDGLSTAKREFEEETGIKPDGEMVSLGAARQKSGKIVTAWAFAGDCDPREIRSNYFSMEWPPRSGKQQQFPEIDRAEFFTLEAAKEKIVAGEYDLLQRLAAIQRDNIPPLMSPSGDTPLSKPDRVPMPTPKGRRQGSLFE